jgi:hypothetical protein
MGATQSNTGALHPVAMLTAMTGPSTSRSATVAKDSTAAVQSRPATTSGSDLPPAYEDGYSLDPWRLRSRNVYKRRLRYGGRKVRWDYGVSDDAGCKPDTFFKCMRQTKTFDWRMNSICLRIVKSLESHRKELSRNCHCDLEYIKTGKTCRDTSRLCDWEPGKTGAWVWDAMKEHDKECSCGAFKFSNSRAR